MFRIQNFLKHSVVSVVQWIDADYQKESPSVIAARPDKGQVMVYCHIEAACATCSHLCRA